LTTTGDAGPFTVDIIDKDNVNVFHEEGLPSNVKAVVIDAYGTFTVMFTDAFGCSTELVVDALCECDDLEYNITQPTCHLGNGKIEIISPMGSMMTSNWTQWPAGADAPTNNALEIDGLTTGVYVATFNVSIPDPTTGNFISCEFDETFDLTECDCELKLNESDIEVNGTILCDQPNGSIIIDFWEYPDLVLNHSGSDYSLIFKWTDASGAILQESNQFDIVGLPEGIFKCTITDISGCEITKNFKVENKLLYESDAIVFAPCDNVKNGSIEVEVSLYHPDMEGQELAIQWSNGETGFLIENLEAGTYNATITDNFSGCEYMESYVIEENESTEINDLLLSDVTTPKCEGDPAIAVLSIIGGNEPYEITWSPNVISTYPDDEFRFWESGTYVASVMDFCGNQKSKSFDITVPEPNYSPLSTLKVDELVDCEDWSGQTTLTFEGGQLGFKIYKRSNYNFQDWNLLNSSNPNLEIRTYTVPYDGNDDAYKVIDGCGNEKEVFVEWSNRYDFDLSAILVQHCHPDREQDGNGRIEIVNNNDDDETYNDQPWYNYVSIVSEGGENSNLVLSIDLETIELYYYFFCLNPGVYKIFYDNGDCRSLIDEIEILATGTIESGCGDIVIDETCEDGIQNGSETGIDCGGPDCDACEPDNNDPIKCEDINIILDTYDGNGLISGDIFYYGPTPPFPLVDIVVRQWGGGSNVVKLR
jgi:hypothetical protein